MSSSQSHGKAQLPVEDQLLNSEDEENSHFNYVDDSEGYPDDYFLNELQDIEIGSLLPKQYRRLNGVDFDDDEEENDDEEEEEEEDEAELLAIEGVPTEEEIKALAQAEESEQEDDGYDVDSDEERNIMKEIREDIELKVREEMKEELNGYKEKLKAIEEGRLPGRTDDEKKDDKAEEDDEMNPKLKEAIIKMNKLDKILKKKLKREKEVKRERLILERRMRQEISVMEHGSTNYREIKMNTEKFLALAPPPSHSEGISLEPEGENDDLPPLFQTQIDDSEIDRRKNGGKNSASGSSSADADGPRTGSSASNLSGKSKSSRSGINGGSKRQGKKAKKDFIKRNRELAAEADQPVAMTDDEKRRLQILLEGVDELPELDDGDGEASLVDLNPFQVSALPGEGFCPDVSETRSLTAIDRRLQGLMPEEDYRAVFTAGSTAAGAASNAGALRSEPLFTRVGLRSTANDSAALDRFGERVLYETKEERELQARLTAIESQLELFKAPHETEDETPRDCHLTDQQLDDLLDQCARNMASAMDAETPESTPRSHLSSRQSLLANPPKLSDEQLQQLLSDAHFPLSSRLLALRDDDQKMEEEDGNAEVIRAETWIAIRDAQLGDNTEADLGESSTVSEAKFAKNDMNKLDKTKDPHNSFSGINENKSKNNAYDSNAANESTKAGDIQKGKIDDFAYTPDITNPAFVASDHVKGSLSSHSSVSHERDVSGGGRSHEARGNSGGARPKYSDKLPRLPHPPHPPQPSASSALGASLDSDSAVRFNSSSYASTSRDSFDSSSTPTPHASTCATPAGASAQNPVRLPEIASKSFLIHTPQGMNNDEVAQPRGSLPSRQPLQMVRNNLSDMSVTSFSGDDAQDSGPQVASSNPSRSSTRSSSTSLASKSKAQINRRKSLQSQERQT